MLETVFRTDDLPAAERFARWSDLMRQGFAPMRTFSEQAERFQARQRLWELGSTQLWQVDCSPSGMERPQRLVRQSDPETCLVYVTRRGRLLAETADRDVACDPGDLYIQDTSHPSRLTLRTPRDTGRYRTLAVMIPRAELPLSQGRIDRVLGLRMPAHDPVGGLLSTFLSRLADGDAGDLRPADAPRLGVAVKDLVIALFGRILDSETDLPAESREHVLALRIREFILHNLWDPDLCPARIAAAHHISVSHLHQTFRNQESTVSRWVRHQRLEHARRDLADLARLTVPVQEIAVRWGFRTPADFTRAFRAAYGMPPREYRHLPQA
jgi:AraC-like DNA-binding protein